MGFFSRIGLAIILFIIVGFITNDKLTENLFWLIMLGLGLIIIGTDDSKKS